MEELLNINWAIILPIIVIQLIVMVVALVDLIRIEATNGPKWMWALLILFFSLLGPILYFVLGRRNN
ncbi:PLD nuclease N-terminal domain-containing protein [Cytobacillus sp. FJAT-54145]|uniref:PLD nuclease N-terminal domain-containing protein n=1 Tax=Cytobacillus spartinae TaxID=3299023 RepID=A0ABW6KGS1_9BACI